MADKRIDELTEILIEDLLDDGTMWLAIGINSASANKLNASALLSSSLRGQTHYTTAGPHAITEPQWRYTNLGAAVEMDFSLWTPAVGDWCIFKRLASAPYEMRVDPQATHYIGDGAQGKYIAMLSTGTLVLRCYELTRWEIDEGTYGSFEYEV